MNTAQLLTFLGIIGVPVLGGIVALLCGVKPQGGQE